MLNSSEIICNNLDYLNDLLGNDKAAVKEIIAAIKMQWKDDSVSLLNAVEKKDQIEIQRLLHRIKSTLSPFGPEHIIFQTVTKQEAIYFEATPDQCSVQQWKSFIQNISTLIAAAEIMD